MNETATPSILIVDDEPEICELLTRYLQREGFSVAAVGDGVAMRRSMQTQRFDLVVLDVRLPGEDGFSLARELRRDSKVGILMLTAKNDVIDRVAGLESGADDYMPKPFHPRELLARVRSILRRQRAADAARPATRPAAIGADQGRCLSFPGWRLHIDSHQLLSADGREVELSPAEFALLCALVENPQKVLSRDFLLDRISGRDGGPFDRAVDVHISNLRRKLEADPKLPALIKTVRGAGYRFVATVERE